MTQAELYHAIAQATGDPIAEITRRGFSIADPLDVAFDPEPSDFGRHVDWDALDQQRHSVLPC